MLVLPQPKQATKKRRKGLNKSHMYYRFRGVG